MDPYQQQPSTNQPQVIQPNGPQPSVSQPQPGYPQQPVAMPSAQAMPSNPAQKPKHNPQLIGLIIAVVLLVAALGFAGWAYSAYLSQKNNVDEIAAQRSAEAVEAREEELRSEFKTLQERAVTPFTGPDVYGALQLKFPRDWSVHVENEPSRAEYRTTIHAGEVTDTVTNNAFVYEVLDKSFTQIVDSYERDVVNGKLKSSAITIDGQQGVKLTGELSKEITDAVVILLPLRDKTVALINQAPEFRRQYTNIINTVTYSP